MDSTMGKHIGAYCYITCSCQSALSICPFASPFVIGGGYKPYFAQGTAKGRRQEE